MLCFLLKAERNLATHQAYEHLEIISLLGAWVESAPVLTAHRVTRAALLPPVQHRGAVKLTHPAFLAEVRHAVVHLDWLPKRHVPVSEQPPLALAVHQGLFIFGNFGVVTGPQILDISLRTPLGPSTSLPPLPVTPVIVFVLVGVVALSEDVHLSFGRTTLVRSGQLIAGQLVVVAPEQTGEGDVYEGGGEALLQDVQTHVLLPGWVVPDLAHAGEVGHVRHGDEGGFRV